MKFFVIKFLTSGRWVKGNEPDGSTYHITIADRFTLRKAKEEVARINHYWKSKEAVVQRVIIEDVA
jgi:hypothetical protein